MSTTIVQQGKVSKTISVATDSATAPNFRLRFVVDIYRPIAAEPAFRFNLTTVEGEAVSERILLHRVDGQEFSVRRTKVDRPDLSATTEVATGKKNDSPKAPENPWGSRADRPAPTAAPGDVWLELAAQPTVPAGTYRGIVKAATDHPDVPELHVPYILRVRPYIEARPQVVRFWTAPGAATDGRYAIVTLSNLGDQEFKIIDIKVSHPELFSAAPNVEGASSRHLVRMSLADDLDAEKLGSTVQGWLRVLTDDPRRPEVEVPVVIAPKKALSRRAVSPAGGNPPPAPLNQ